jgi:hypothetical protein
LDLGGERTGHEVKRDRVSTAARWQDSHVILKPKFLDSCKKGGDRGKKKSGEGELYVRIALTARHVSGLESLDRRFM